MQFLEMICPFLSEGIKIEYSLQLIDAEESLLIRIPSVDKTLVGPGGRIIEELLASPRWQTNLNPKELVGCMIAAMGNLPPTASPGQWIVAILGCLPSEKSFMSFDSAEEARGLYEHFMETKGSGWARTVLLLRVLDCHVDPVGEYLAPTREKIVEVSSTSLAAIIQSTAEQDRANGGSGPVMTGDQVKQICEDAITNYLFNLSQEQDEEEERRPIGFGRDYDNNRIRRRAA